MSWVDKFKAGWNAPPGSYRRSAPRWEQPAPEPRRDWDDMPPPKAFDDTAQRLAESEAMLAEREAAIAELLREIEGRDAELERRRAFIDEQVTARQALEDELAQANDHAARLTAAMTGLIGELEQAREQLTAAAADRDRYQAELAAGMTPALRRRFLRAALIVLHPDKWKTNPEFEAFAKARYNELEEAVAKIGETG
jgi:chromosome segregation ATPase